MPFSWVIPLVIGGVLGFQDQGQDLLQQFVEWERAPSIAHRVLPWFGIMLLGGTVWYSSRILLGRPVDFGGLDLPEKHADLRKWYPRMLGALSPLLIAGAFFRAAYFAGADGSWLGWVVFLLPVLVGVGFLGWLQRFEIEIDTRPVLSVAGAASIAGVFWALMFLGFEEVPSRRLFLLGGVSCAIAALLFVVFILRRRYLKDLQGNPLDHSPRSLSPATIRLIWGLLGLCWFVGALITAAPVRVAPRLGSVFLVLLVGAVWTGVGGAAMLARTTFKVPLFGILVLWLLAASFVNDYHVVVGVGDWPVLAESSMEDRFQAWDEGSATLPDGPVFLVVGEGGGVRAAYWTGSVLAELQEADTRFVDHVLAISTVSGSSLGGAVFMGLTEEGDVGPCGGITSCTDSILAHDFLSPLVGMLLTSDIAGKFIPLSIFDRSRGIEAAFENAWLSALGNDRFSRGLPDALPDRPDRPILYMNSTRVETGKQMVLGTAPWLGPEGSGSAQTRDLRKVLRAPPSLAGAVHNSARFPIASPAGRVDTASGGPSWRASGSTWGRIADGGYYELSGGATALDFARSLCGVRPEVCRDRLHVIAILNGPDKGDVEPDRAMTELLSPVWTLFRAREARAEESLDQLETLVGTDRYHELRLCAEIDGRRANLPLGWHLSERAQRDMKANLSETANRAELDAVWSSLGNPGIDAETWSCTG